MMAVLIINRLPFNDLNISGGIKSNELIVPIKSQELKGECLSIFKIKYMVRKNQIVVS